MSNEANSLSHIATVIKAAASHTAWGEDLSGKSKVTIQEVQCMQIGEKLFIAANCKSGKNEIDAVASYLARFKVTNRTTLEDCLATSHRLMKMDANLWTQRERETQRASRTFKTGVNMQDIPTYSTQDRFVIDGFSDSRPAFLIQPFAAGDIDDIQRLVASKNDSATEANKYQTWRYRKFLGITKTPGSLPPP